MQSAQGLIRTYLALCVLLLVPCRSYAVSESASRGQEVFQGACASCHTLAPGQGVAVGPNLAGVVGRGMSSTDYPYSEAFRQLTGQWTAQELEIFLSNPIAKVPGTAMTFSGITSVEDRADLVAFLETLK